MSILTATELAVLRNVLDNERSRGVTDENRAQHDAAMLSLIDRKLIHYNPKRERQKFNLTPAGREALETAERHKVVVLHKLAKEWS